MSYFPLCIDLTGAVVLLVGDGPQTEEKRLRLSGFQAELRRLPRLEQADLDCGPAMVIIGDTPLPEAEAYQRLCLANSIPVNVVDVPSLCTFYFPALVQQGDLTVGICTGGKSPGLAACLRRRLEAWLPRRTGEILQWLYALRPELKRRLPAEVLRPALRRATEQSLTLGRPLTEQELEELLSPCASAPTVPMG